MQEKKKKIIILSIAIVAVIAIIAGSTYAYWQITKTQKGVNDMVAACLDITMQNESGTFGLDKAWPISDEEGEELTGYTFEVKNNCDENVNYIVGFNSVEGSTDNYLADSSIKIKLDKKANMLLSELDTIEYSDPENTETVRASKLLSRETLEGKGTATHTVKAWIDENAPVTEQGKIFRGQVFITGGQGIIAYDDCFTISEDGTILSYDYACGYNVSVPATIGGIEVKTIKQTSFAMANMQMYDLYNEDTDEGKEIYYITDENVADDIVNFLKQGICEDPTTCRLEDIEAMGLKIIVTEEEFNAIDWEEYKETGYEIDGPYAVMFNSDTGEMDEGTSQATSLDLSDAIYLESIEEYAFYGKKYYESNGDCEGEKIFFDTSGGNYCVKGLEKLILPENGALTTIGDNTFRNNNLTTITIPSGVREIGDHAFSTNFIKNIDFPESVETIGERAFEKNEITQLDISVPNIGSSAFYDNKLTKVTIGSEVVNIGDSAFTGSVDGNGNYISSLIFENTPENPSQLKAIGIGAFESNNITGSIIIPSSVETIGYGAFHHNSITEVVVNAKTIGGWAFRDNKLNNVTIGSSVEIIEKYAFEGVTGGNQITSLKFEDAEEKPSQLKAIGIGAFESNNITGSIIIPSSVETIEDWAFSSNNINKLIFSDLEERPSHLTTISLEAFFYNNISGKIVIPSSVTTIGQWAFHHNSITEVVIKRTEVDALANMTFGDLWNGSATITYDPNYTE